MSRIDLAYTRHAAGDLRGAESLYRAMIAEREDVISAANNLFILLRSEGRWAELAELYRLIEPLIPANGAWAVRLYRLLLSHEQYEAGWQWYEARRHDPRDPAFAPRIAVPEWTGQPVEHLLVWREQGFGDEIQFARFIPELARRGIKVTLLCNQRLDRLLRNLPADRIPLAGEIRLPARFDAWCLLGSLPLRLGAPFDLPAPLQITASARTGGGLGVKTHGSERHANDANRSLPPEPAAQLMALPGAASLAPETTGAADFQDTADIIAGLDAVVTVDTSIAHLAGSMGKPTFVLLPAVGQDWRWLHARRDSPWYPSVRLFRQSAPGDWGTVLGEVTAALKAEGFI